MKWLRPMSPRIKEFKEESFDLHHIRTRSSGLGPVDQIPECSRGFSLNLSLGPRRAGFLLGFGEHSLLTSFHLGHDASVFHSEYNYHIHLNIRLLFTLHFALSRRHRH